MKKMFVIIIALTVALCAISQAAAPTVQPSPKLDMTPKPDAVRAKELPDLKWGMYLCWSFCCFSGKQWTPNVKDISLFNPSGCDTEQWARTAKEAGMGFICFLTKHHDGFCLWDTATSDRKVTKSPLSRDVLAELRKSCDKYGIKLALYYSESEWRWPGAREGEGYYNGINPAEKKAQIKELLTRYGPIEFIWFDNAVGDGGLNHTDTTAWVKSFQPNCFVGFSSGQAAGDMQIGEDGRPGPMDHHAVVCPYIDNNRFDRWDPSYKGYLVAEILQPIIAEPSPMWFYDPSAGENCRTAEDLYATYLGAVNYGNLFDLGVSPNREGKLRDVEVATLRQVGDMIRHPNVRPAPLCTGKSAKASSAWKPEYDAIKAVDNDDTSSWVAQPGARSGWLEVDLGREEKFGVAEIRERFSFPCYPIKRFTIECRNNETDTWKVAAQGATIGIKRMLVFPPVTARYVRLNILDAEPVNGLLVVEEFRVWPPPLSLGKPVEVSSIWPGRDQTDLKPAHITDGDTTTIWAPEERARSGWVIVDLQEEGAVTEALLSDAPYGRTREFDLEAEVDGLWKMIAAGTAIGPELHLTFPSVKARRFRLNIRNATDTPVVNEFQLFAQ